MREYKQQVVKLSVLAVAVMTLAGCGNLSKNVAANGLDAGQLVWPAPSDTTPMHKGGTAPALATLRQIHAGMNKHQIAQLIGYPHFDEGAWGVREWDYLFHLPSAQGMTQCQYKILFNKDLEAQSFRWRPGSCAALLKTPVAPTPLASFTVAADALFAFDSAKLNPSGTASLDKLASDLSEKDAQIKSIRIVGYTDAMGSSAYNGLLSTQRAYAVMHYLAGKDIPAIKMTAVGLGAVDPVKTDCATDLSRTARIACLAPNRRVAVQVFGKVKESP